MYRGAHQAPDGSEYHAHQCPRCSIIYLTVTRVVEEKEAEMLEASLYLLPMPSSDRPRVYPVARERSHPQNNGTETQES